MKAEESSISFTYDYCILDFKVKESLDLILDKLKTIQTDNKFSLQVLDPTFIVSERQLEIGIYHTLKAIKQEMNIARDIGTELLVRLTGKRQIRKCLKIYGLSERSEKLLVVCFSEYIKSIKKQIELFLAEINLTKKECSKKLPVTNPTTLANFYNCKPDIVEIENYAIEKMATLVLDY